MNKFTELSNYFKPRLKRTVSFIVVCSVFASSAVTASAMSIDYCVVDGSNVTYVSAVSNDKNRILQRANVDLNSDDTYQYDSNTNTITVMRAFDVSVKDQNGNMHTFRTNNGTVADAINQLGINVGPNDVVSPSMSTPLYEGMPTINISTWNKVTVNIDNEEKVLNVVSGTVLGDALKAAGLGIDDDDAISVDRNTVVVGDMSIDVNRISTEQQTVTEAVPYGTIQQSTSSLPKGQTQVQTPGVNGERVVTQNVTTVDGQVVATEELNSTVTKEPTDEVVLVGTATTGYASGVSFSGGSGASNGAPIDYSSMMQVTCTAYTGGGTCATGVPAAYGYVAVNPNQIPYGTQMYICSPDGSYVYGYAIAADTGGAMMSGSAAIDLYFDTMAECTSFGRQTMNVYIL